MGQPIRAVLFDMDGVLVETEHLKAAAHAAATARFGGKAREDLYASVMGQPHTVVRAAFIQAAGVDIEPVAYTEAFLEIYLHLLDTRLQLTPGIRELLAGLATRRFILALVTSSLAKSVDKILSQMDLGDFFKVRISADDVRHGKPDPEPYLLALDRLGLAPAQAVVIEDTRAGIDAAIAAGLPVIAFKHQFNAGVDFSNTVQVLDSLADPDSIIDFIEKALKAR